MEAYSLCRSEGGNGSWCAMNDNSMVKMHKAFNGEVEEPQSAPDSTPPAKGAGTLLPGLEKASRA